MIKHLFTFLAVSILVTSALNAQQELNMIKLGDWDETKSDPRSGTLYNDIWGYTDALGNEYAVIGSPQFVQFVDVTDPTSPALIAEFEPGASTLWRDFKAYKSYVYGVADEGNEGLLVFDMSALPNGSITKVNQTNEEFARSHNIFIDVPNGLLYVVGVSGGRSMLIYDIAANPVNPPVVGEHNLPGGYIHDVFVRDNIAYCSHGNNGFYMYDFSDPSVAVNVASISSPGYNHSSWITDDGNTIVYAEEVPAGQPLGVLDVSQAFTNNEISEITFFKFPLLAPTHDNNTPHNPFIVGDYVIVSYYEDGVQAYDISDPANPSVAGYYDTAPNNTNYNGTDRCWGVYPFFPSGNMIASDTEVGLVVIGTTLNLPSTCDNGVQDGDELGVDCGGFCAACTFPPAADFTSDVTLSCGSTISFSDLSANGPSSWLWNFGDGSTSTDQNPTHTYAGNGTYTVTLTVTNDAGTDMVVKTNFITIDAPLAPSASDIAVCFPSSATLTAIGNNEVQWFDVDGNYLASGFVYNTPVLSEPTTYFVENVITYPDGNVGPLDWTIGSGNIHGASEQALIFEVYREMTLVSVFVNTDQAKVREIRIRNTSGSFDETVLINIPSGQTRVNLNVTLPPGSYSIGGNDMDLFRNDSGSSYPYSIADLVDITGSTAGPNYYYYFYDWEVIPSPCRSAAVEVNVNAAANSPVADFSSTEISETVFEFMDNSTNATSWSWDFGDGNTSTEQNPTHTYANIGTYTVTLTVTGDCGMSTTTEVLDVVSANNDLAYWEEFSLTPNPTDGELNLTLLGEKASTLTVKVYSALGQEVFHKDYGFANGQLNETFDFKTLANGTYLLQVQANDKVAYKRFVVGK